MSDTKLDRPTTRIAAADSPTLAQLLAMRDELERQLEPLALIAEQLKQVKMAIKDKLYRAREDGNIREVQATRPDGDTALLIFVERSEFDGKRFASDHPDLAKEYRRDASRWELRWSK